MANAGDFVTLNVGREIYSTPRSTLLQCSYFEEKISPSQNIYKIDRDGKMFRHVLNFLRCGKLMLPESFTDFTRLQAEADFFEMEELSTAIRDKSNPQVIGLNVGGKDYWVSKDILKRYPNSIFEDILHGQFAKDDKGNYHIDHDGEVFQYVLNFLKFGNLGLPEGFDEFELLKQQVEFFRLKELEQLVKSEEMMKRRVKMVGFFINGQVFKLRREDVLRETMSEFASIVRGTLPAQTDAQGNFIIEKNAEDANNLMHYISHGGIFKTMTSNEVERLKEDASRFGVSETLLGTHLRTMRFERWGTVNHFHLRVILYMDDLACNIAYANKEPSVNFLDGALKISKIQVGSDEVFVGKINIEELKRKDIELKSVTVADIASSISRKTGLEYSEHITSFMSVLEFSDRLFMTH